VTPQQLTRKKRLIYLLIGLGFAGLIGAHEFAGTDGNADMTVPLMLAAAGTVSFAAAGLLARRLMKEIASK
jgi:hypothetical protein